MDSDEYEATKYAMAADRAAKMRAPGVPVDISREDSTVVETYGGRETGADYTLRAPAIGAIEFESEVGDVEVSGLTDNVTIRDVAGGVNVEAPQGNICVGVNTDARG